MEREDIEAYLQALNEELAARNITEPASIVVVGGVFMIFFLQSRPSTKDVDIVPLNFPDTTAPNKETKMFQSAVRAVAKTYGLERAWMNDVVAAFAPDLPEVTLWRQYSHLQVFAPPADYILALKLLAGREKDESDIVVLC